MNRPQLHLIGTSNLGPLRASLGALDLEALGLRGVITPEIVDGPFDQVIPVLSQLASAASAPEHYGLVWAEPQRVLPSFAALIGGQPIDHAALSIEVERFAQHARAASQQLRHLFVATFAMPVEQRGLGIADWNHIEGVGPALMRLNVQLHELLRDERNVTLLDAGRWTASQGAGAYDPKRWLMGKIAYRSEVFDEAARDLLTAMHALQAQPRKLIVLDLDNTLWGGVIGDDGLTGISLGADRGTGEAFLEFQRALLRLERHGIVLAICSKNTERVASQAIEAHPEMLLRLDHFAAWRINWQDKVGNIVEICNELNLGLAATVFIDDSPAERDQVRTALPDVLVPEWPSAPERYVEALESLRCFDRMSMTSEDRQRTHGYVTERERQAERAKAPSLEAWLEGLKLHVAISSLTKVNLERAAQLLNKTNQFNLCTRRMSEAELWSLHDRDDVVVEVARVTDRFGDYGLTCLLTTRVDAEQRQLWIDDFVLSCRVLGRGVESRLLEQVYERARRTDCREVYGTYIPTERNQPCAELFARHGFERVDERCWRRLVPSETATPEPTRKEQS